MNDRHVIGRRIVAVKQSRVRTNGGATIASVDFIELENGVRLVPAIAELVADYSMDFLVLEQDRRTVPDPWKVIEHALGDLTRYSDSGRRRAIHKLRRALERRPEQHK